MAQQTAVEWLVKKISDQYNKSNKIHTAFIRQIIEKAKEIEKQQIINAFDIACEDKDRIGKEYYYDTYGK